MSVGIFPLARVTFDMDLAHARHGAILTRLEKTAHRILGGERLLTTTEEFVGAYNDLRDAGIRTALILQLTFTDAEAVEHLGQVFTGDLSIWSVPEARTGDRLRLNSFCGLHLASHSLSCLDRKFRWHFGDPEQMSEEMMNDLLDGDPVQPLIPGKPRKKQNDDYPNYRVGVIGEHPPGFTTCRYDAGTLEQEFGVTTVEMGLRDLFAEATELDPEHRAPLLEEITQLEGSDHLAPDPVGKSLDLSIALDNLAASKGLDGFALKCWPEMFTDYGAAACAAASLLGERRIPCACECDVFGALSQIVLNDITAAPSFLTDIVDMDIASDTGVIWHCGQAPRSMCPEGTEPRVTVHSNRREPLLFEFPLKPGNITLMRISRSYGATKLILFKGTVLDAPMAYSGTSGVVRFERTVADLLPDMLASGLEHHVATAYGDHRPALRKWADNRGLPILEL